MKRWRRSWAGRVLVAIALAKALAGCGGGCPEGQQAGGICAGVPAEPVCGEEACTEGVACSATIEVDSAAALASAASSAAAGACIVLKPGSYPAVALPGG